MALAATACLGAAAPLVTGLFAASSDLDGLHFVQDIERCVRRARTSAPDGMDPLGLSDRARRRQFRGLFREQSVRQSQRERYHRGPCDTGGLQLLTYADEREAS